MDAKSVLLGFGATMMSNTFLLLSSYTVKTHPLHPAQIMTCSALIQMVIFGVWSICNKVSTRYKRRKDAQPLDGSTHNRRREFGAKIWGLVLLCNLGTSLMCLLCYFAVKMLPLSDYVVFCFTSPLFTLITSTILLRSSVNFVKISMCLLIVTGAALVAQPTFLFGPTTTNATTPDNTTFPGDETLDEFVIAPPKSSYTLGAILCILVAAIGGFVVVFQAKCKQVPSCYYFFSGSGVTLLVGLSVGLATSSSGFNIQKSEIGYLVIISSCSMLGMMFIQVGVKASNPILVSATRSTEIVMALFLDIATAADSGIDFNSSNFKFKVLGSALVTISIVGIALADPINEKLSDYWTRLFGSGLLQAGHIGSSRLRRSDYEPIFANDDEESTPPRQSA